MSWKECEITKKWYICFASFWKLSLMWESLFGSQLPEMWVCPNNILRETTPRLHRCKTLVPNNVVYVHEGVYWFKAVSIFDLHFNVSQLLYLLAHPPICFLMHKYPPHQHLPRTCFMSICTLDWVRDHQIECEILFHSITSQVSTWTQIFTLIMSCNKICINKMDVLVFSHAWTSSLQPS